MRTSSVRHHALHIHHAVISRRIVPAALAILAALVVLSACRPNETVEGQAKDAKIKAQVKSKLASDVGAATITALSVDVTNGVVTIAGPVHSQDEKTRVGAAAKSVEGVVGVNDAMQIQSAGPVGTADMTTAVPATTPIPTP